ncbi:MAG: hypothetical protein ACE5EX_02030 [Phycisphaerae bacterium]
MIVMTGAANTVVILSAANTVVILSAAKDLLSPAVPRVMPSTAKHLKSRVGNGILRFAQNDRGRRTTHSFNGWQSFGE